MASALEVLSRNLAIDGHRHLCGGVVRASLLRPYMCARAQCIKGMTIVYEASYNFIALRLFFHCSGDLSYAFAENILGKKKTI